MFGQHAAGPYEALRAQARDAVDVCPIFFEFFFSDQESRTEIAGLRALRFWTATMSIPCRNANIIAAIGYGRWPAARMQAL